MVMLWVFEGEWPRLSGVFLTSKRAALISHVLTTNTRGGFACQPTAMNAMPYEPPYKSQKP